jgi:hypothetical protein
MRGTVPAEHAKHCRYGAAVTDEKPVTASPATLVWAVRLLYLECAGLAALTAYLIVLDLTSRQLQVGVAISLTVMTAIGAVSIFYVTRLLGRRVAGARGPAVAVQLFVIAAAGFWIQTGPLWAGLLLMALGVVTGLMILLPPTTRALGVD